MREAREIYQGQLDGQYSCVCDYSPMLSEIGSIILQEDDDDYQGDSFILYQDGERIGYLTFGWGSCSGCDALQACQSYNEVQELMDDLVQQVKWFESSESAAEWFKTHDWAGDWSSSTRDNFVSEAIKMLSKEE